MPLLKQLFLHIGLHKTGTTSIQRFCKINRGYLKKNNIFFPKSQNDQHELSQHVRSKEFEKLQSYFERLGSYGLDQVLISSENLSRLNKAQLEKVKSIFDSTFEKVTVIVYIRNQPDAIESIYTQMLKNNNVSKSIDQFWRQNALKTLDYFEFLNAVEQTFLRSNLVVKNFDKIKTNLIESFACIINLPYKEELIKLPTRRNTKPSVELIKELLINKKLPPTIYPTEKSYKLLSKDQSQEIREYYLESNNKTAQKYFDSNILFD